MGWKNNQLTRHWNSRTTGGKVLYSVAGLQTLVTSSILYVFNKVVEAPDNEQKFVMGGIALGGYLSSLAYAWAANSSKKRTSEEITARAAHLEAAIDEIKADTSLEMLKNEFDLDGPEEPQA